MRSIIQILSLSNQIIYGANWEVDFSIPPSVGHPIQINAPVTDKDLIAYSSKLKSYGVILDGSEKEGYTITFTCSIKTIKHMVDIQSQKVENMIMIIPENRASEHVMMYLFNRQGCDANFLQALKNR